MNGRIAVLALLAGSLPAQAAGVWRGVLASPGGDLPFRMEGEATPRELVHGAERRGIEWSAASRRVAFPPYESWLALDLDDWSALSSATGRWHKVGARGEQTMPVRIEPWPLAAAGDDSWPVRLAPMFPLAGAPLDVAGRWRVRFSADDQPAVAVFAARGDAPGELDGTFLTVTGDYRYLAGTARGDELRLACFDGAHAFLFAAQLRPDGLLAGEFWSGGSWHEEWTAVRDGGAALPDAFTLTRAAPDVAVSELRYLDSADPTGEPRRIGDLFGELTLIVVFGTWCPNCGDSGPFLRELLERHRDRGLRIVGLAFEHGADAAAHAERVTAYRARYAVPWPILLGGPSDKRQASAAFPAVDAVRSYPTTLFVDRAGAVRAVHQGFSGPATGAAYDRQRAAFEATVARLLAEGGGRG